jgi:hypothetical protein
MPTQVVKFNSAIATGNQVIPHSLGEIPSAMILLVTTLSSDDTGENDYGCSIGITDWTNQYCKATYNKDNAFGGLPRGHSTNQAIAVLVNFVGTPGAVIAKAVIVGRTGSDFTINWSTKDANAYRCTAILFGANVQAKALHWNLSNSPASIAVTGAGFKPEFAFHLFDERAGASNPSDFSINQTVATLGIGVMDGLNQWFIHEFEQFLTTTRAKKIQNTNGCIGTVTLNATLKQHAAFTSWDNDGFTVYQDTGAGTATNSDVFTLVLKGIDVKLGSFSKSSGIGTDQLRGASFTPELGFFLGGYPASLGISGHAIQCLGVTDGITEASHQWFDQDALSPNTNCEEYFSTAKTLMYRFNTGILAQANVSLVSGGFDAVWTQNDGGSQPVFYFILKDQTTGKSVAITDSFGISEIISIGTGLCSQVNLASKPIYDNFNGAPTPLQNHNLDSGEAWIQLDQPSTGLENSLVLNGSGKLVTKAGTGWLGEYQLLYPPRTDDYDGGICFSTNNLWPWFSLRFKWDINEGAGWAIEILPGESLRIWKVQKNIPLQQQLVYNQSSLWIGGQDNLIEYSCRDNNTKIYLNGNLLIDDNSGPKKAGVIQFHIIGISNNIPQPEGMLSLSWFYFDDSYGATGLANKDLVYLETLKALETLILQKITGDKNVNIFETFTGNEVLDIPTGLAKDITEVTNITDTIMVQDNTPDRFIEIPDYFSGHTLISPTVNTVELEKLDFANMADKIAVNKDIGDKFIEIIDYFLSQTGVNSASRLVGLNTLDFANMADGIMVGKESGDRFIEIADYLLGYTSVDPPVFSSNIIDIGNMRDSIVIEKCTPT